MVVPTVIRITGPSPLDSPEAPLQTRPLDQVRGRQAQAIDKLSGVRQSVDPGDALGENGSSPEEPPGKKHWDGMAASDHDDQIDRIASQQVHHLYECLQERIDISVHRLLCHGCKGWDQVRLAIGNGVISRPAAKLGLKIDEVEIIADSPEEALRLEGKTSA
jgi:hypothetical protein